MRLIGKAAVVTGGAQGIGLACAKRLIREGAMVTICDVNETTGQKSVDQLCANGKPAYFVSCDVGMKSSVDAAIELAAEKMGSLDILINNAGIGRPAEFLDVTEEDFDLVLKTNLKGAFLCGQAAARRMVERDRGGAIVNMSSVNAIIAYSNGTAYASSKGGINQLTRVMAISLATYGIRVNAIGPGTIETELTKKRLLANEESRRRVLSRTPLGRCGTVDEVASIAAFLASEDAAYITGQTIYPDGGRLALNSVVQIK